MKAQYWAYRDRKTRKRNFRNLWIQRINAACRQFGTTYSRFMEGLAAAKIEVDRKVLSDLAIGDETAFKAILDKAVAALNQKSAASFMEKVGPRFVILPTESVTAAFPNPLSTWKTFSTSGFNIAKGKRVDLTVLLKPD